MHLDDTTVATYTIRDELLCLRDANIDDQDVAHVSEIEVIVHW